MIEIKDGRVFVGGKETVDPTLIGYAVLDFAENPIQSQSREFKEHFERYIANNGLRNTLERKFMLSVVETMDVFSFDDLKKQALEKNISLASIYNFKNVLINIGIILPEYNTSCRFNDSIFKIIIN